MQIQQIISSRLASTLEKIAESCSELSSMVRPTQDPNLGDFQINSAMPLAKKMGGNPRQWAEKIVAELEVGDLCVAVDVAGPGFINLRLNNEWIAESAADALQSPRQGVAEVTNPATIVIDYSSPNVAKPMHVGHVRSTVIGDALARIFRFSGHKVISDNHLGDWGTQFGMIIYGYRNFLDTSLFAQQPVQELLRIYKIVNRLIGYQEAFESLPKLRTALEKLQQDKSTAAQRVGELPPAERKKGEKDLAALERRVKAAEENLASTEAKISEVETDPAALDLAKKHPHIGEAVLRETAKLHAGDEENLKLWRELLPYSMDEINRVYRRLDVHFDHVLGESFYHPMLAGVVENLQERGLATVSEGAVCVFLEGFEAPMIVQKQDGAFLYSTTDLATIEYRLQEFKPDEILYVVDFRQSEHFQKLFAAAKLLGVDGTRFVHVQFGTVLDEAGRPMKTRSGTLAGLESLLDEAVGRAYSVVCESEHAEKVSPPFSEAEKKEIAECVGIGAIKYADLAHHRTSDYKFSLDKMIALEGNTSAYVQYAFARIQGILRSAELTEEQVVSQAAKIHCNAPAERSLMISLLRFEEVLHQVHADYAPNLLVDYLYEIAKGLSVMYEHCPVLKADDDETRWSRLSIITLAARILRQGLQLLGIGVVPRM